MIKRTASDPDLQARFEELLAPSHPKSEVALIHGIKEAGARLYRGDGATTVKTCCATSLITAERSPTLQDSPTRTHTAQLV